MAQILVTRPGVLSRADKQKLRAAGCVAVEAERPEDVRLIDVEGPPMNGNDLAFAALKAMAATDPGHAHSGCRNAFVRILADLVGQQRKADAA